MGFDSLIFWFNLLKFQGHTQIIIASSLPRALPLITFKVSQCSSF
jgi:hypothetical protein